MARNQGTFDFSANLEVNKLGPLDARLTVEDKTELTGLPFAYIGMVVSVTTDSTPSNNGVYVLSSADASDLNNWTLIGTGSGVEGVYDSALPTSQEVPNTIGGIESGTTVLDLEGKTFSELFDNLLFPSITPTTTAPSITFTENIASLVEIGSTNNISFVTGANLGTVNNTWNGTTLPYAGAVSAASYSGTTSGTLSVGPGDNAIDDFVANNLIAVEGVQSWGLSVTFGAGVDYADSNGNTIVGSAYAGGTLSKSVSFEGVYPIFLGNSAGGENQRALVSHSANNITCEQNYNETSVIRHTIAIPNDMIDSSGVEFQQFNTLNGQWASISNSDFTASSVTRTVQGNVVNYTLYTKSALIGGAADYRIVFL